MNFLEARRLLAGFSGGPELSFLFALSGTGDPFRIYLEAAAAKRGRSAKVELLPFNTLHQHLATNSPPEAEVILLLPSDLLPEADWRSGVPPERIDLQRAIQQAELVAETLRRRAGARVLYLPSPIPPLVGHLEGERMLAGTLEAIAKGAGATVLPAEAFSLSSYFSSGCPVGGASLGQVAEVAVDALTRIPSQPSKVLITDLDNTLWSGVIAEDGLEGISFLPEGPGYRHHVYQSLLARFRGEGVLLAAVSRNDADVVAPPFRNGLMPLGESDFVTVVASYHAKSAQIRQLAQELNLGLEAFVFVDDNPVELEEVQQALPQVRCLRFPKRDEEFPAFLARLAGCFDRQVVTSEDRERTEMYRRRLTGMAPAEAHGADLTRFLASLRMRLMLHDRSEGERTRALQLINKTNQFNANGRRWTEEEVSGLIDRGGRLFGASLSDRSGSHGEIIACLVGHDGVIEAFVMSCRVFQRRVEYAFLASLARGGQPPVAIRFGPTERNAPFAQFIEDAAFGSPVEGRVAFDAGAFDSGHAADVELFEVSWD